MTPRMQAHPRLRSWLGDALAAGIIVAAAFAPFQGSAQRPSGLLEFAIVLAPAVLLPLRRRRPIPVLAAIVVLSAAAAVLGLLAPGVVLATAIAMFAVTNRSSRRVGLVVTGVTVVAVVLLSVVGAAVSPLDARAVQYAVTVRVCRAVVALAEPRDAGAVAGAGIRAGLDFLANLGCVLGVCGCGSCGVAGAGDAAAGRTEEERTVGWRGCCGWREELLDAVRRFMPALTAC